MDKTLGFSAGRSGVRMSGRGKYHGIYTMVNIHGKYYGKYTYIQGKYYSIYLVFKYMP